MDHKSLVSWWWRSGGREVASGKLVDEVDRVDAVDKSGDGAAPAASGRGAEFLTTCSGGRRIIRLLEQGVYLRAGSFESGGRIRSIQINGIKGGFHNSVDVAGVIRDWE